MRPVKKLIRVDSKIRIKRLFSLNCNIYSLNRVITMQLSRIYDRIAMITRMRAKWRQLRTSPPGQRFQDRYFRIQRRPNRQSIYRKILNIFLGIIFIFVGIIFWFIPGPGWLIIIFGTTIIAGESLCISRFLDKAELFIRKVCRYLIQLKRRMKGMISKNATNKGSV